MKKEKEQYEEWLQKVKETSPILRKPDELSIEIFDRIDEMSRKKKQIKFVGWCSATAVGFLLCFLVYETYIYPTSSALNQTETVSTVFLFESKSSQTDCGWKSDMNIIEKNRHLSAVLKERKEREVRKKKLLYTNYQNNNLTK